ncbi:class I SAM-dependent methyltransferase [Glycomyces albidus]|jgi:SAM-dependent methyltransferase|uniref:Methyltransferase domain-containing protein n=1 Tax=Glycomyces albidus TaxID=2656774 RepID=A0A6L5GEK5_9ACTN|nr:class I SAM-dependent methyltransferase [Glycomyces albidus]MQM28015.1 methyltransferase domain-containing protein [Glycomyces albidus]
MAVDVERTMGNYRDAGNLKSRVNIYRYRKPDFDLEALALELLPDDLRYVLDVGAGFGRYTKRIRAERPEAVVVALDKSPGMLAEVPEPAMVADAQSIPYPDGSVDAVLAMHMLYHVPDVAKAVGEFRRVLRPGGTLVVSTNAHTDMAELYDLWNRAVAAVPGAVGYTGTTTVAHFDSANAPAYLEAAFDSVEAYERRGVVAVPEPGPLLDFLRSARSFFACGDNEFEDIVRAVEQLLADHFAHHETFDFNKESVFYRCR